MKNRFLISSKLIIFMMFLFTELLAQNPQDTVKATLSPTHRIIKNDNSQYIGTILSQDAREVLILTEKLGEIIIPKHEIKEIRELQPDDYKGGVFIGEEFFATRYFLTTNGLPVKKGESYTQWNIFGPDFQFAVADNLGLGIMTSWVGMPIVGTIKYSINLGETFNMALGGLLGTGSWAKPGFGMMLPFTAFTMGNRTHNINFSTGYGLVFYTTENYNYTTELSTKEKAREGRFLLSLAGMTKVSPAISLVFDSFIVPPGAFREYIEYEWYDSINGVMEVKTTKRSPGLFIFVPGIRWQTQPYQAFQFGFTGMRFEGEFLPVPIPMLQWYRKM